MIDDYREDGENFKTNRELGQRMRANTAASRNSEDPLSLKLRAAVKTIEDVARPHLKAD